MNRIHKKINNKYYFPGIETVKIPKEEFDKALKLLSEPDTAKPKLKYCHSYIHNTRNRHKDVRAGKLLQIMSDLRRHLMDRNWVEIMRLLKVARPGKKEENYLFPILVRYCMMCLVHHRGFNLLDSFLNGVTLCASDEDKEDLFFEITRFQ